MENASKALIIAGAILMSILLISVGILVFNSSKGIADDASQAGETVSLKTEEVSKDIEVSLATREITFEIDGKEYKAKEGMTWKQWVNDKKYNTDGLYVINNYIFMGDGDDKMSLRNTDMTGYISPNEKIAGDEKYWLIDHGELPVI